MVRPSARAGLGCSTRTGDRASGLGCSTRTGLEAHAHLDRSATSGSSIGPGLLRRRACPYRSDSRGSSWCRDARLRAWAAPRLLEALIHAFWRRACPYRSDPRGSSMVRPSERAKVPNPIPPAVAVHPGGLRPDDHAAPPAPRPAGAHSGAALRFCGGARRRRRRLRHRQRDHRYAGLIKRERVCRCTSKPDAWRPVFYSCSNITVYFNINSKLTRVTRDGP